MHAEGGKPTADALVEARRRDRPHRLGRAATPSGCCGAAGSAAAAAAGIHGPAGVPAARRDRRDRPVELPDVDPDGLDRVRAGRRQRRRVQAERVHARPSAAGWSTRSPRWCRSSPVLQVVTGARRDRGALVPAGRGQGGLHRLDRHRQARSWRPARRTLTPVLIECGGKDAHDRRRRRRPGRRPPRRASGAA